MANEHCDLNDDRPASHTVQVRRNGREVTLHLCDDHYQQLIRSQSQTSPFDSLFSGFSGNFGEDFPGFASELGIPLPRDRESTNIEEYISEHTKELIQQAAETAVKFGQREVDTEHLLYALTDSDVVQEILKQYKLKGDDIKTYHRCQRTEG